MKKILSVLLTVSALLMTSVSAQNSAQAVYNQGVALFNEEKYDEALVLFEQVLQANPSFVYARNYAARCKTAMARNLGPKNDLEGRLSRVIIPEIAFADAPIGDVLDYLASRAQEITKGETVVNFIYKGTPEQRTGTPITLSLRSVPLSEAIKYVGELSRSKVKYEPHAVVIDPNPGSEPAPAAGGTPAPAPGFAAPTPTTTPTSKSTFP
jgi:tetratricopeptide (TPR) repeat protein